MRVLMLSLDRNILQNGSLVQKRLVALAAKVGEIAVLVSGERDEERKVSEHLTVYSVGGIKPVQFLKMWRRGKKILRKHHPLSIFPPLPPPRLVDSAPLLGQEGKGGRQYDLITVQDTSYLALLAYLLAKKFQIPLEIQVHGLERFSGIRKRLAAFLIPRADKVRVVSARLKQLLTTNYSLLTSKIYVLPVYTQIEVPRLQGRTLSRGKGSTFIPYPFTFLTVGRLAPVKNIAMQIRAFARLEKEIPHVRLVVVGNGVERRNLQQTTDNLQLSDKIKFEGRQEHLERYYNEADAFLLTSDSEGYGVVIPEAAAHRLPIIMTDVGLAGEFIKNGENGLVIPLGDEKALVSAMKRIIEDVPLRARLGETASRAFRMLPRQAEQIEKQVEGWRSLQ